MIRWRITLLLPAIAGMPLAYHPATAQTAPPGKGIYERVCKVCHGEDGKGDAGPRLVPFERDADEVIAIVREGLGQMPPIAETRVSDDDIKAIVAYLTSLTHSPHGN